VLLLSIHYLIEQQSEILFTKAVRDTHTSTTIINQVFHTL